VAARTPVLVGVGTVTQRVQDPRRAEEPIELMRRALQAAVSDSGAPTLVDQIDLVLVPKGIWEYGDPGRLLSAPLGIAPRTVLAEVGVLQQTLLTRAAQAVAAGWSRVVLICGGEAKARASAASRLGVGLADTPDEGEPDEIWRPHGDIITALEIERDLAVPAHQYALVENALGDADDIDDRARRERLGHLWGRMAATAAANQEAWDRSGPTPAAIVTPSADNRMIASPYTKALCSQWNVDQAAALLVCAADVAAAAGVHRDRCVFPVAAAESNAMIPLPERAEVHRCPAAALLGDALRERAGLAGLDEIKHLDLYSCFPAAVAVQARELRIRAERALSLTGGMTFHGGPLNSYVLHATAALARRLREDPSALGLVTSVSGMLTKVGGSIWSATAPAEPFVGDDVTHSAQEATAVRPVSARLTGPGRLVAHTVLHERGEPSRVVAVVEADTTRTVAICRERRTAAAMRTGRWAGRPVALPAPGRFTLR
jgi:acetyl-CoA C-acetyltransferase